MTLKEQFMTIVTIGIEREVTDIHFQPFDLQTKIYYRQYGILHEYEEITTKNYLQLVNYIKYISNLNISQNMEPQDGTIELEIEHNKINIRISTIPLLKNESLVLRIIPSTINKRAEELTWQTNIYEEIKTQITNDLGLFVFTGPTGSGKTTLMYQILKDLVDLKQYKVITIENPIEIRCEQFVQMQINEEKKINYDVALKSILRQDPDIIMIGEIRDEKTARAVMRAALTGHTILTTMHTKNKYGVIERLIDFGFNQSEVNSVLSGICNQRLLHINGHSKIFVDYINVATSSERWQENETNIKEQIKSFEQRVNTKEQ